MEHSMLTADNSWSRVDAHVSQQNPITTKPTTTTTTTTTALALLLMLPLKRLVPLRDNTCLQLLLPPAALDLTVSIRCRQTCSRMLIADIYRIVSQ